MTYKPEKGSRQPVVLYDKDNKAIDVSGIEELSSVKIDTGKIAGDLKLVKDNQGRLYGKYGEAWIPVKVDSEGRPIISSDVTVNAEGMVVDLGQIKQGPAGTEPWPVQLSGNIVEHITLVNAIAHTESGFFYIDLPDLTKYRDFDLIVTNTTDQDVWVWVRPSSVAATVVMEDDTIRTYGGSTGNVHHKVPSGSRDLYLSNIHPRIGDLKTLNRAPFKDYLTASGGLTYRLPYAPTSGALTIILQGVLR